MIYIRNILVILLFCLAFVPGLYSQSMPTDFNHIASVDSGLGTPLRLAIDGLDNIYVTDVNQGCIRKYDASGNLVGLLAQGFSPVSLAISPDGILYFGDEETGDIYRLNAGGQPELFFDGTHYPSSMAFSPDKMLYVADNDLKTVLVIDVSGDLTGTVGQGTLIFPTGLAFDAVNDHILVAEHGGIGADVQGSGFFGKGPLVSVYIFDRQGNKLGSFGSFGSTGGKFYRIQGMAVGRCGNIYICEPFQGNVNVFTAGGAFITKFGEYGDGAGQLNLPMDVAFDSQDRAIVSCYNKGTLELFYINDPLPSASVLTPDVSVCEGATAEISFRLTGTPPWSLTYTFNGGNPITFGELYSSPYILNVSQAGEYRLIGVSDANGTGTCVSGAAKVSHHPQPTASITCGDLSTCEGSPAMIPVDLAGDGPWTLTYTRNGGDPVTIETTHNPYFIEAYLAGTYQVTALSGSGCEGNVFTGSSTVSIIPCPSAIFTAGNTSIHRCYYDPPGYLEVAFTGTGPWTFTYTVDEMNPTIVEASSNPYYLLASEAGSYEIILVSDSYCSRNRNESYPEIVIDPEPTVEAPATLGLCKNSENHIPLNFTGTAPWTFTMTKNGANPVIITTSDNPYLFTINKVGTYQVTTLSDFYCTGNPVGVVVSVYNANPPTANIPSNNIPLCGGQSANIMITFHGASPWTFTYTLNGANPATVTSVDSTYNLVVYAPGSYQMTALSDASCTARKLPPAVTVVQYPFPVAGFSYTSNELQVAFTNLSTDATLYTWNFGDSSFSNETNPVHLYAEPGEYMVTLEAYSSNCGPSITSDTITLALLRNSEATVIPAEETNGLEMHIYPNPSRGLFTMELKGDYESRITVEVITLTGTVLFSEQLKMTGDKNEQMSLLKQFDLSPYGRGVYLVQVRCGEWKARKLVTVVGE